MKIGIDIRSTLKKTKTGIGRYTIDLISALGEIDTTNQYALYSKKKVLDFKRRLPKLPATNFSHCIDYFNKGPGNLLSDVRVFHTSSYDLEKPKTSSLVVTIHDVIHKAYPEGHTPRTVEEIDRKLKDILPKADSLVADCHNTKSDLIKFYGVSESKITVIYPGVKPFVKGQYKDRTSDIILFVGTLEPRKNIDGVIKAFTLIKEKYRIPHKLYIVGMKGWSFEKIFEAFERSKFKKDIIIKGYVSDEELSGLYNKAQVFVYPSFYEGFGLPIIEAFSAGVPVVTSKSSSCGEIAGDSALLVDPYDHEQIGEALYCIIQDKALRENMAKKGFKRAKEFTWKKTAKEFVRLFTEIAGNSL